MPGRLRKNRVKAKSENNSQVSRVGKQITCSKCYEKGHNRRNCDKEQLPKLPQMKKQPGRKREPKLNSYASNKGGGRGSRGGRGQESGGLGDASGGRCHASGGLVEASGSLGESNAARFQANTERGKSSGGRGRATGRGGRSGRARGRGGRGQGRGGKSRGRGVITMLVDEEEMNEEEIRKNMEHEYMEQILIEEEEKRIAAEKAIQEEFDEEAVRLTLEEEARYEKEYQDKIREDEESEYIQMCYNHGITPEKSASTKEACGTAYVQTQESIVDRGEPGWRLTEDAPTAEQSVSAQPSVAATETTPKGKTIEADAAEPPKLKKQGRKRKIRCMIIKLNKSFLIKSSH
ncbi:hypothetical protein Tco_0855419 [Tanacetum coccineum]